MQLMGSKIPGVAEGRNPLLAGQFSDGTTIADINVNHTEKSQSPISGAVFGLMVTIKQSNGKLMFSRNPLLAGQFSDPWGCNSWKFQSFQAHFRQPLVQT